MPCFLESCLRGLAAAGLSILLCACGGGGGGGGGGGSPVETPVACSNNTAIPATTTAPSANTMSLVVDNGPAAFTGNNANRLFASVTLCKPGTTNCTTIDHVLVDTGSTGLRLFYSSVSSLGLATSCSRSGKPLLNCVKFVDNSYIWGPVVTADVTLGSKTVSNVPIQVQGDPSFSGLASACATGGPAITSAARDGINGILGLGLFKQDCGAYCTTVAGNGVYFTCSTPGCHAATGTTASSDTQITNPTALLGSDNNGVVVQLPAVASPGTTSISGTLRFGVGTQANNVVGAATPFQTNTYGYVTTVFNAQTMSQSFIDSGSNGLFFGTNSLTRCSSATDFYCPASSTPLSATIQDGTNTATVNFTVDNAQSLFLAGRSVLPTLAGPMGNNTSFDWGLPFFYGRSVFIGIEGMASPLGTGPYYAF